MSGSCSLITCWQQLSSFREVSNTKNQQKEVSNRYFFDNEQFKLVCIKITQPIST